jgi:tetratricopeptide (TPR) repeat protein
LRQYDEAFYYWKKSYEQEPSNIGNYYSMAFAYTELKQYDEAAEAWEEIIAFCERAGLYEEAKWPKRELQKIRKLKTI